MPFNPQTEFRGDRYLFEAITGAGQAVAQGVKQWQQNRQESQSLDERWGMLSKLVAPMAMQPGGDPKIIDELAKFPTLSLAQKRGKLAGLEFLLDQNQKQQSVAREQARHEDDMGMRRAAQELQRGQLLAGEQRQQRDLEARTRRDQDTMAVLLGLSGQTQLPSPVDPSAPGAYLQQQYPNADPDVMKQLLNDFTPAARKRLEIDQGNLDVARDQVANRREQISNETQRVTRKTLTPSALAAFQKAKADLRRSQMVGTEAEKLAIQSDIDQLDALMADSLPAKPESATTAQAPAAKRFNPMSRKLE